MLIFLTLTVMFEWFELALETPPDKSEKLEMIEGAGEWRPELPEQWLDRELGKFGELLELI